MVTKHFIRQLRQWMAVLMLLVVGAPIGVQAQEYITDVMTIGVEKNGGNLQTEYRNKGWTVLGNDLNRGAGGWDIYIIWKTSSTADPETGYITDLCVSDKNVTSFEFEGRTYYRAANNPGFDGDLNKKAGGAYIYVYYTRDRRNLGTYGGDKRVITRLSVTDKTEDSDPWTAAMSWRNSENSGIADMNKGAGGDDIFIQQHFTEQTLKWKEQPTFATNLTYNGQELSLITKDPWRNNSGDLLYRVDGGSWYLTPPTRKDVGNYKVEAMLEGVSAYDYYFANNSTIISKIVTINPPILKPTNLKGVFNQGDKKVNLSWEFYTVGNYRDLKFVVYRDGTKIAELPSTARSYADGGFTNEATPTYEVYYVSNFWNVTTRRDDTKASVTVNTTRSVPINNLMVETLGDRLVFTWKSDAYPKNFGNKFRIYIDDEASPLYTLSPDVDMQKSFRWEHRTTDKHTNRQNKVDEETGVPYTEEPLNACEPHNYRIEGVIGNVVLNNYDVNLKAVGEATRFYSLEASKGVHEGQVKLSWHVNRQGSDLAKTYIVERRRAEQESEAWEVLNRMASAEDYLFYTDETALPGVFYDYRITVEDKCPEGNIIHSDLTDIGFAKSSGTVTGRISFGNTGVAVQGVDVVMTKAGSEDDQSEQFHSIYFADTNGTVSWQYPSEDYAANQFADGDFSIQMWLYPESFSESLIADFGGGIGLGMTASGQLTFRSGSTTQTFGGDVTLQKEAYNHVVLTRSGTTLTCYLLDGSSEPTVKTATLQTANGQWKLSDATQFELGHFKGAVDEFRLWTKCLSEADILENYDHLLVGDESQLETYWTFDEGLRTQFFDYSRDGSNYRKHHGQVGSNAQASTLTPGALKLKAKTDEDGNYIIQGIPFTGGGTNYSVVPLYGIHEFNPTKTLVYVCNNALVHTVDYEDVSSFPMEGYVYYAGTNIPAEGIQLYVDGTLQTIDGEVAKTDANGRYLISVPIGQHYVEAKAGNHTMVDKGRFPTEGTYNFDRAVTYDFADSTLVNFVGRVGGGERNDTLAVGFGESHNNIGVATVKLKLNNESFSFNCLDDHISPATQNRPFESDTTSINSTTWAGFGSDSKYIYIQTDPQTGEFSAKLPPLKYVVRSIDVDNNPDIEFTSLPQIDLTNVMKEDIDSLTQVNEQGDSVVNVYKYHTKMVRAYYSEPQVEISQPKYDKGVFGIKDYEGQDDLGDFTVTDIWTQADDGTVSYKYGFPIYNMGDTYMTQLYGYEVYTNYDSGEPVVDVIPLVGQVITVSNEMSSEQQIVAVVPEEETDYKLGQVYDLKKNQLVLDSLGTYTFKWIAGGPNVISPYTRHMGITLERNNRTYSPASLDAIVVGSLPMGNNFITNGPDQVLMVLRDPPGAKSKTVWKTGTVQTKVRSMANGGYGNWKGTYEQNFGVRMRFMSGVGIYFMDTDLDNTTDIGGGLHYSWNAGSSTERTWSITATEQVSTGTSKDYCGSKGDVFIGYSTNLLLGSCRKVGFFRDNENAPFLLKDDVATSLGDSVTTKFMYSAYEIEEVMMPKWKETRNSYLTQHFATEAEARAFVNNTDDVLYATWLKEDDEHYGEEDTYVQVIPASWEQKKEFIAENKVSWCNAQIEGWRQTLENNEKDKVKAIETRDKYWQRNISFDGGTSYTYTDRNDTSKVTKHTYSHQMGGIVKGGFSAKNAAAAISYKAKLVIDTETGWTISTSSSDYDENQKSFAEFDYVFEDGNKGTDFSVDIYKSPGGWSDIFYLFGGQSYNPYQKEEKTKYYEPGQHTISNGTVQMEQPFIKISPDGGIAADKAVVSDVAAGSEAQFTLHLSNSSTTNQDFAFVYNLMVQEMTNQHGLEVLMDGVPANGRSVYVPNGETVKKVITVRQTDQSVLDYEGIELWFMSQYQPIKIYDKCSFDVHFKPSSSPVDLVITEPVLNTDNKTGEMDLKLTNFNRQFRNLKSVGVQYRFAGNTQWTTLHTWVTNKADSLNTDYSMLPTSGDLRLKVDMSGDISFPEGQYEFRGFTTTPYGTELVQVYSDLVAVTKDMTRPRSLTTPSPVNGILGYGDDLMVEFNEDIVPGYVSDKNVIVTAKLNQQTTNHDVSLRLLPYGEDVKTVNPVFMNGDFSLGFWLNWQESGTVLHLGAGENNFALSIDSTGHAIVSVAGAKVTSSAALPKDEWTYFALAYRSSASTGDGTQSPTFSLLAQYGTSNVELFKDQPVSPQASRAVSYADDNYLYLGPIYAYMHDLCLYDTYLDVNDAAAEKYQAKDGYVQGLANYWPMNEGHGFTAADTRHTHDFTGKDSWQLANVNYALRIDDSEGAQTDISSINTSAGDSYAIEMWYNPAVNVGETVFETATPTVEGDLLSPSKKLKLSFDDERSLILSYGTKQLTVVSHEDFPALGATWHHLALNVVRGQAASFYLDGQRTAVIAENDVPALQGSALIIGKGAIMAYVDELRIWKATLSESRLLGNMYNAIDTADVYSRGLVAYYPFEKAGTENGVATKVSTMEDMAPTSSEGDTSLRNTIVGSSGAEDWDYVLTLAAPPVKNAPDETRLIASPTASERKVVINLTGAGISPRDIEGTTLNITVAEIHDLHGNTSNPIRWTAYVNQNTLKWKKDSVNIFKQYGDDYTFDVNIENTSGQTEYYTLYNMPQWLTVVGSSASDDVQPLKTKTLRFEVNPLTAVGNYDVTIGLQGNNQILEPLRLVMKVSGDKPDWTVDPTQYEHEMTLIGQVRIGGILMQDDESLVAAFIGDECRGVAAPEKIRGAAYVTLPVYGLGYEDADLGKPVSFRIWDASTGVAYTDVDISTFDGEALSPTFVPNQLIGNFDQPVIWTKGNKVEQNIRVNTLWNWVALGVVPEDLRPIGVFPSLTQWSTLIKDKDNTTVYSNGTEWRPNGIELQPATMYKMKIERSKKSPDTLPAQLPVSGVQLSLSETPMTLENGWNWLAYTPLTTMSIDAALAGANPQRGDYVKSQTAIAIYGTSGWEGSLKALESGHGYMYYSTDLETKQFVYPSNIEHSALNIQHAYRAANGQSIFTPVGGNAYSDNMTMVIELRNGAEVIDTCEIAAFIDEECRGAARAADGLYYLIIAGEGSGQPIALRTCLGGEIVNIDNSVIYTSDRNIGTPWEPYIIDLGALATGIDSFYGISDDDGWYTLQGIKLDCRPVHPGVYIHEGRKVTIKRTPHSSGNE